MTALAVAVRPELLRAGVGMLILVVVALMFPGYLTVDPFGD